MATQKNTKNVAPKAVPKRVSDPSPSPNPSPSNATSKRMSAVPAITSQGQFEQQFGVNNPNRDIGPVLPKTQFSGGGGGGGGGGGYGPDAGTGGGGGTSFDPYFSGAGGDELGGDAQYQAQLAALMKALQDSNTDFGAQRSRYETNFGEGLRGLGYTPEMQDNPDTLINEAAPGAWSNSDLNTASGRALTNQQNDFASRGLLQSSLYAQSKDDLMRSLTDQLGGMQGGRTSFLDDLARQQGAFQNDNTSQQQQARAEALARRASGLAL